MSLYNQYARDVPHEMTCISLSIGPVTGVHAKRPCLNLRQSATIVLRASATLEATFATSREGTVRSIETSSSRWKQFVVCGAASRKQLLFALTSSICCRLRWSAHSYMSTAGQHLLRFCVPSFCAFRPRVGGCLRSLPFCMQ